MPAISEASLDESLRAAAAVAVLVHGVGDHTQVDILRAAYQALATDSRVKANQLRILGILNAESINGLKIEFDDKLYIVLPFVWSQTRRRLLTGIFETRNLLALFFFWRRIPAFLSFFFNLFRCIGKTRGWRRLVVLVLAVMLTSVSIGLVVAMTWAFARYEAYVNYLTSQWNGAGISVLSLLILFITPAGISLLWWPSVGVLDFVADVAAYVGSPARRRSQLQSVRTLVASVAAHAPDARLIIVGHSLGSVIVADAVASLPQELFAHRHVLLITLGSPLRTLSEWFPSLVPSPLQLCEEYRKGGYVELWTNFWRTGDRISSRFDVTTDGLLEAELGEGGHTNYWRDLRLWVRIQELLQVESVTAAKNFALTWHPEIDTQGRALQRDRAIRWHQKMLKVDAILFVLVIGVQFAALTKYRSELMITSRLMLAEFIWGAMVLLWVSIVSVVAGLGTLSNDAKTTNVQLRIGVSAIFTAAFVSLWCFVLAQFYIAHKAVLGAHL